MNKETFPTNESLPTLEFSLIGEQTIKNTTVKLAVTVDCTVPTDKTDEEFKKEIKTAIRRFVDTPDWTFSNINRTTDASGVEKMTLRASVRVPESENYNLEQRAKDSGLRGLRVHSPQVDTSVPLSDLKKAESELRQKLLKEALEEAKALSAAGGVEFVLQGISFTSVIAQKGNNRTLSMASSKTAYGSGFSGDDDDGAALTNAAKLTLTASVLLAKR